MGTEYDRKGEPDLSAIWDAHTRCEFETRDPEATLETMVEDNYVNHIPTMTGGMGKPTRRLPGTD
jgi:carboxymethylenebutenolidase